MENPGFEAPEQHSDGKERDEFDIRSSHALLSRNDDGSAVGTVRIVLPKSPDDPDLPIHRVTPHPAFRIFERLPPERSGEISRFTLPKKSARRGEGILPRVLSRAVHLCPASARKPGEFGFGIGACGPIPSC